MTNWTQNSGQATPWAGLPTPTPPAPVYVTGNILKEDGFNLLQEDGFKILFETIVPVGFQPITNPATAWA
jgi:hypothetical protein